MRNVYNVKGETSGKRAYMQCKGAKKYHTCDNNKAIRMDELEEILLNSINELLKNCYDEKDLNELYNQKQNNEDEINFKLKSLDKERFNLEKRINDNKNYYKKLYEDKVNDTINENMFLLMSKDYLNEIETCASRIEIINNEIASLNKESKIKTNIDKVLKKYKQLKELNKIIVDEFIDKIYIGEYNVATKTRDIEIIWNFDF